MLAFKLERLALKLTSRHLFVLVLKVRFLILRGEARWCPIALLVPSRAQHDRLQRLQARPQRGNLWRLRLRLSKGGALGGRAAAQAGRRQKAGQATGRGCQQQRRLFSGTARSGEAGGAKACGVNAQQTGRLEP